MLKIRKVVVISPTATHNRKLCTVVPISSTAPRYSTTGTTCYVQIHFNPMATRRCG
ncbi:type II toxin-antitoxin system PemK/MazF family toxin [Pseudomonas marginalis]|uniref:type II toxin-antitoxin system PemK/MazF family toxin n=1 Tax=Pseudomonas marginalis TaxID=298 RepID=UPI002A36BB2B|nr:type II toxin-antitoxin system PemK/MazF family toxin [Pseudomonas marginalis]WPN26652.1 type II toxin-antitoxin system PemK/MazF family toxin [Pseudomonas marginalis]